MPERDGAVELNYRYPKTHRGQGFALEAARAILVYGFESLDFEVINANTDVRNDRSITVLQRLGFQNVGETEYSGVRAFRWEIRPDDLNKIAVRKSAQI